LHSRGIVASLGRFENVPVSVPVVVMSVFDVPGGELGARRFASDNGIAVLNSEIRAREVEPARWR